MNKILSIIFFFVGLSLNAQQDPHYTQYMYNMSLVNPAYMINEPGLVEAGSLYRTQWVGIDGAPNTANIFANIPLSDKVELGVNYSNDRIGENIRIDENIFNVDFAYKIKLNPELNLSFGLKAGIDNIKFNFSNSNVASDGLFQNQSNTVLNIGTGVFLFHEDFYVGLSAPNLLPNELDGDNGQFYRNNLHLFLIGGYIYEVNDVLKLKPSTVIKQVAGAPLTFDISANALYNDKFELGVSYRYQDAITGMVGIEILRDLRVGYAYDFNASALNDFNNGSHEFIMTYRFDVIGLSKKYSSPRFY